jgi:hypothetical protein
MEPVTGLPWHNTVQSTPAPRGSFTVAIERVACWLTPREIACCDDEPPPIVKTIGPACTRELLEHPESRSADTLASILTANEIPVLLAFTNPSPRLARAHDSQAEYELRLLPSG